MTFTDAAREVLRQAGRPLHYKEITELAIEKNLLSHVGKSPEVTMGARLAATLKKEGDQNPLVRVKPGVFALREWDDETIKQGLDIKRTPKARASDEGLDEDLEVDAEAEAEAEEAETETEAEAEAEAEPVSDDEPAEAAFDAFDEQPAEPPASPAHLPSTTWEVDIDAEPPAPDEEMRAEIAASATEVFAEEDDDDQPILRRDDDAELQEQPEGRRRRRRRRRRGSRGANSDSEGVTTSQLPSYTTAPAFNGGAPAEPAAARGPQVIELAPADAPPLDGLAGRDLAEAVAAILTSFDRTVGAVSLRQIAETAQRRGKLTGDAQLAQSQIAAAVRADNARRTAAGTRCRFRLAGGRVGLTDWLLEGDLARYEREALAALSRYRDAARRAFVRKLNELPGHAFTELCILALERIGVCKLRQVKFPGASGSEAHFSALLTAPGCAPSGKLSVGEGLRLAIVIRRDGRDIGRERITELRGTVHHYGHAGMGWILTAGQVLSGAREETAIPNILPVSLLDGAAIAMLCEEHGVAVLRAQHPICIPDVDLFEALRAS